MSPIPEEVAEEYPNTSEEEEDDHNSIDIMLETPTACATKRRRRRFSELLKPTIISRTSVDKTEQDSNLAMAARSDLTRAVQFLRAAVVIVLLVSAAAVSAGVYQVMRHEEQEDFETNFRQSALQLVEAFHEGLEQNLGAVASMSTAITSYALTTRANNENKSFPCVLMPDFELRGADLRVQSGSNAVVYAPLVTDDTRQEWEDYALQHRGHIDEAYEKDTLYRAEQDQELAEQAVNHTGRQLEDSNGGAGPTVLDATTGYHPKIFGDSQDEPKGSGPYFPVWQRSPIEDSRQALLNYNVAPAQQLIPNLQDFLYHEKKAIFNAASTPSNDIKEWVEDVLMISQFRHKMGKYANDLHSYLVYPVFDSFDEDKRQVAGILITDVFWKFLFRHLLPHTAVGIVCVIENNRNQTFSYRVDGPEVTFLDMRDAHDPKYDDQEVSRDLLTFIQENVGAHNRAYKTVGLSNATQYRIRVFPSQETEQRYVTHKPLLYALVLVGVFTFACALLITYSCLVEKRQVLMMQKVIENARRTAEVERDLNEFLAHEVRNPLSAAISASTFVSSAVNEAEPLVDHETLRHVREDMNVVNASLNFINDFLREMLDIYKATGNHVTVEMSPTDLKRDIFEPVASILCQHRAVNIQLLVDCPDHLIVLTDSTRLRQVILNLIRNASKFVSKGFIRLKAEVVDHQVFLYVEDSGPGVAPDKRGELFSKYRQRFDMLSQGTGIGLALAKKLMEALKGDLALDENYHSGVEGFQGARFVVQLNATPLDIESALGPFQDTTLCTLDSTGHSHGFCPGVRRQEASDDFSVVVPTCQENPQSEPIQELPAELPENLSCLFVDDDNMLRRLFMRAIKKVAPSWKVQEASSGEKALQIVEESSSPFNLIFMDQYMESTEKQLLGTETVEAMRKNGVDSKICGLSANDVRALFLEAGADDFLLKPMPCKPDKLKAALLKILDIKQV